MKNQKGFLLLVGAIIVLVSVVVAISFFGYQYYVHIKNKPVTAENQKTEASVNEEDNKTVASETEINGTEKNTIEIDQQAIIKGQEDCNKIKDPFCYLQLALITGKKEMCEAIDSSDLKKGDYKSFCLAVLNKNTDKCGDADGQSGIKVLSKLCLAIVKKDYNLCDDSELKAGMGAGISEMCRGWVLYFNKLIDQNFFKPIEYCKGNEYIDRGFTESYSYENEQQCYQDSINMIIEFGNSASYDESICNLLINKDICYSEVAINKKDINICRIISNSELKNICIETISALE